MPGVFLPIPVPNPTDLFKELNSLNYLPSPYANRTAAYRTAYLCRPSEIDLGGPVAIRAVYFNVTNPQGAPLIDFTIRSRPWLKEYLDSSYNDDGLIELAPPKAYIEKAGWNAHPYDRPYCWNGQDNFTVDICVTNPPKDTSYSAMVSGVTPDSTSFSALFSYYDVSDSSSVCAIADSNQPKLYRSLAQMGFEYIPIDELDLRAVEVEEPQTVEFLNTNKAFKFEIQNFSCVEISNPTVCYQLNNNQKVCETINTTLSPGEYYTHRFTDTELFDKVEFNEATFWLDHPQELYPYNDTLHKIFWVVDENVKGRAFSGKDFWVGFMQNLDNGKTFNQVIYNHTLFLTSIYDTKVNISIPRLGYIIPEFEMKAFEVKSIVLPKELQGFQIANDQINNPRPTGIHITASKEISVYGYSDLYQSVDGYLAIPTDFLDKEYVVVAPQGTTTPIDITPPAQSPIMSNPSEVLVVATKNGTRVSVNSPVPVEGQANQIFQLNLNAGETVLLKAKLETAGGLVVSTHDLTGLQLTSNENIAVFSGVQCGNVPFPNSGMLNCDACDHLIEAQQPTSTWGKQFITSDFEFKTGYDVIRVMNGPVANNQVTISGGGNINFTEAYAYKDIQITKASILTASKGEIFCTQFATGAACDITISDPFMMNLISEEQWGNFYSYTTPITKNYRNNYVTIIKRSKEGKVGFDGILIPNSNFSQIDNSDYYEIKLPVNQGPHEILGDSSFIVQCYGFGFFESYGYPASGAYLDRLDRDEPEVFIGGEHVKCPNSIDGSVRIDSITGGTPPFKVKWSTGDTTHNIDNLPIGTYTVTITDAFFYTAIDTFQISAPEALTVLTEVKNQSCSEKKDGEIILNIEGGTPPYSVNWSDISSNSLGRYNLSAGNYKFTVSDSNNCVLPFNEIITKPQEISISPEIKDVTCFDKGNGEISVQVSGGTQPYNFDWSYSSQTNSNNLNNLPAGTYSLTVTDSQSCKLTQSYEIYSPLDYVVDVNKTKITCHNENDGEISMNISGASPPYQINWTPSVSSSTSASNLSPGSYTIEISDQNNCIRTEQVQFKNPPLINHEIIVVDNNCFGDRTGEININSEGGVPPFTYEWIHTSSNSSRLAGLPADTYSVQITDDVNCTNQFNIPIEQGEELTFQLNLSPTECDNATGTGLLNILSGEAPFTISWKQEGVELSNSTTASKLGPGYVQIEVLDNNGCRTLIGQSVPLQDGPEIKEIIKNNQSCFQSNDASIKLEIQNGNPPYTCNWSNNSEGLFIENLASGDYKFTLVDQNNCILSDSIHIQEEELFSIQPISVIPPCIEDTGSIELSIQNGNPPFNYFLNSVEESYPFTDLSQGLYQILVVDDQNCEASSTANLFPSVLYQPEITELGLNCAFGNNFNPPRIQIHQTNGNPMPSNTRIIIQNGGETDTIFGSETFAILDTSSYRIEVQAPQQCPIIFEYKPIFPPQISLNLNIQSPSCYGMNDGQIQAEITGGTAPYLYTFSSGIPDSNRVNDLGEGFINIAISDRNNCFIDSTVLVSQPDRLIANINGNEPSCANSIDGSIQTNVRGGTSPYTVIWNSTDTSLNLQNIAKGNYDLSITDNHDCVLDSIYTLVGPNDVLFKPSILNINCFGEKTGSILLNTEGIQGNIQSIQWEPDTLLQNTPLQNSLGSGEYSVSITDEANCIYDTTIQLIQNNPIKLTINSEGVDCFYDSTASASVTVSGGRAPYSIIWAKDGKISYDSINQVAGGYVQLQLRDSLNCEADSSIWLERPDSLILNIQVDSLLCALDSNGSIEIKTKGWNPPFQFNFNQNGFDTVSTFSGLPSGTYTIELADSLNCLQEEIITLEEPIPLSLNQLITSNPYCDGIPNGSIRISVEGGKAPYSYTIDDSIYVDTLIDSLSGGLKTLEITDGNTCSIDTTFFFQFDTSILMNLEVMPTCYDSSNGSIQITELIGAEPLEVNWEGYPNNNFILDNLKQDFYQLTVQDALGCFIDSTIQIIELPQLVFDLSLYTKDPIHGYPIRVESKLKEENPNYIIQADSIFLNNYNLEFNWHSLDEIRTYTPEFAVILTNENNWLTYTLNYEQYNCPVSDSIFIEAGLLANIYMPNAFSPNGDGTHDNFYPTLSEFAKLTEFKIYNRWGQLLHDDPDKPWDGTYKGELQAVAVYIYMVSGELTNGEIEVLKGNVTLLR